MWLRSAWLTRGYAGPAFALGAYRRRGGRSTASRRWTHGLARPASGIVYEVYYRGSEARCYFVVLRSLLGPGPRSGVATWPSQARDITTTTPVGCKGRMGDRPCAALRCSSRTGMKDRQAARSCKSADRPSWRAAPYPIGIDARRAEARIAWLRSQEPSWIALPVFLSWEGNA